jgi:hypothetical protein
MQDASSGKSKIRAYLAELPPATRSVLFAALERARASGTADPIHDFILAELRDVVVALGESAPRFPSPSRMFFRPVEPFLIDEVLPTKVPGRVARPALERIWAWIGEHVAQDDVRTMEFALVKGGLDRPKGDHDREIEDAADLFRTAVLRRLAPRLAEARESPETKRRIAGYVGGGRNFDELEDIYEILGSRQRLDEIAVALPDAVDPADPDHVVRVASIFKGLEPGRIAWYAAGLIADRIDGKAKLPRLAAVLVGTDDPKPIAAAPAGRLVDLALSELERLSEVVVAMLNGPRNGVSPVAQLRDYNLIARQLRAAIAVDANPCDWTRHLLAIRTRISGRLAKDLGELPVLLRRCVKPLRGFAGRPPVRPDEVDLDRACVLIELFDVARLAANELALNELVTRTRTEIEAYVDAATNALADDIRTTARSDPKRDVVLAHASSAIRIVEVLFGGPQAALLRRSYEVAAGGPLPERSAA